MEYRVVFIRIVGSCYGIGTVYLGHGLYVCMVSNIGIFGLHMTKETCK